MFFDQMPDNLSHPKQVISNQMGHAIGFYSVGNHRRWRERFTKIVDLFFRQPMSQVCSQDQAIQFPRFYKVIQPIRWLDLSGRHNTIWLSTHKADYVQIIFLRNFINPRHELSPPDTTDM